MALSIQRRVFACLIACCALLLSQSAAACLFKMPWTESSSSPVRNGVLKEIATPRLTATFSMDLAPLSTNTVVLYQRSVIEGTTYLLPVGGTVTVSGRTVTFVPNAALPANTQYVWRFTAIRSVFYGGCRVNEGSFDIPFSTTPCPASSVWANNVFGFNRACRYDAEYLGGAFGVVVEPVRPMTYVIKFGRLTYNRVDMAPDPGYGLKLQVYDLHFDAASSQWIATTARVISNELNEEGGDGVPVQEYSNVPIAGADGIVRWSVTFYLYPGGQYFMDMEAPARIITKS